MTGVLEGWKDEGKQTKTEGHLYHIQAAIQGLQGWYCLHSPCVGGPSSVSLTKSQRSAKIDDFRPGAGLL